MRFLKDAIQFSHFWPVLIVLVFGLLAGRSLLAPGYFNMHDDLQMMRQLQMEKCFLDGQIPCRWVPDMGYGFGFPLFNFYPPLPYLIGQGIRLLGFSFVTTVKLVFLLSFVASGLTMYILAKEFFGKAGAVISAIFYIWAPYHSVDIFVRGAMNEAWALVWFPVILWTSARLIKEKKETWPWIVGLALCWFALLTSHNLMVLIFTPVFAGWCLIFILREKSWQKIPHLVISGILALSLAAFFTLPAFLEQKYVQVETLVVGYYEYIAHFVSLNQLLISRFWGYGPSVWGEPDEMSFQIGHLHWVLSLIVAALAFYKIVKDQKEKAVIHTSSFIILFFVAVGWFSAFMTHSRSTPIWLVISPLSFVQFPWRFLTIVILSFSFLAGGITLIIKNSKVLKIIGALLVGALLAINWNYFKPQKMGPLTDEEKFSGVAWELQQTAGIFDYLPKSAKENPKESQKALAEIIEGEAEIKDSKTGTNWASFVADVKSEKALVRIGIFDFPHWKIFIDGQKAEHFVPENEKWGRMHVEIPQGNHNVDLRLFDTPIRKAGNIISLFAWAGLAGFMIRNRKKAR